MPILVLALMAAYVIGAGSPVPSAPVPSSPRIDPKGRDRAVLERQDSLRRAQAQRSEAEARERNKAFVQALRLEGFPEDCVAYDPAAQACLLTVGGFNASAETWTSPPPESFGTPAASGIAAVRGEILRQLLEKSFLESNLDKDARADSLAAAIRQRLDEDARARRKALGDAALRKLYGQYRNRLFAAREEPTLQILATSDSALADSLLPVDPVKGPWRWQNAPPEEIPAGILKTASDLPAGGLAGPYRTPYGFVAVRMVARRSVPEVPFERAVPLLIALASLPQERTQAVQSAVESYYQDRKSVV